MEQRALEIQERQECRLKFVPSARLNYPLLRNTFLLILSPERKAQMLQEQGGCANRRCSAKPEDSSRSWPVDHDHVTGETRGVLCHQCNIALGMVRDNIDCLTGLIEYLEKFRNGKLPN